MINLTADMGNLGVHWRAWFNYETGTWNGSNKAFDVNLRVECREENGKRYVQSIYCLETGSYIGNIPPYLAEKDAVNYYLHMLITELGVGSTGRLKETDKGLS